MEMAQGVFARCEAGVVAKEQPLSFEQLLDRWLLLQEPVSPSLALPGSPTPEVHPDL